MGSAFTLSGTYGQEQPLAVRHTDPRRHPALPRLLPVLPGLPRAPDIWKKPPSCSLRAKPLHLTERGQRPHSLTCTQVLARAVTLKGRAFSVARGSQSENGTRTKGRVCTLQTSWLVCACCLLLQAAKRLFIPFPPARRHCLEEVGGRER